MNNYSQLARQINYFPGWNRSTRARETGISRTAVSSAFVHLHWEYVGRTIHTCSATRASPYTYLGKTRYRLRNRSADIMQRNGFLPLSNARARSRACACACALEEPRSRDRWPAASRNRKRNKWTGARKRLYDPGLSTIFLVSLNRSPEQRCDRSSVEDETSSHKSAVDSNKDFLRFKWISDI